MAKPGPKPKPKPNSLAVAKDENGAPRLAREMPAAPAILKGQGLIEWRRVTKVLDEMGLITRADVDVVALYCQTVAQWKDSTKHVQDEGAVIMTKSGYPIQNPHLSVANRCSRDMQRLQSELGLTPSARTRLVVQEDDVPDPYDAFLAGRAGGGNE